MADEGEVDPPVFAGADRFQLLVDAVEEYAIFMLDRAGRVASWNSGAQRIKGYAAAEIVGRHFSVFYPASDVADGKPDRELTIATEFGRYREEGWRVRKDGSMFWAHVLITAIRDREGNLDGFAKVTRDETERKAAELAAMNAMAEAVEANASKDRFLSRMSHELRTPLNAILGFGQLLQMDDLPADSRDSVEYILGAGHHLLALIDDVLDISRMESGEFRLSLEPVRLADVTDEAVRMLAPLSERQRIPILVGDLDPDCYVRADRQRLTQVLLNLLSNAIKYNRADGTVRLDAVAEADGRIRVRVGDDGPGLAADDLGRLFQPFERLGAAQSGIEGTGLGLTLSRTLMTAMSGEIGVESEPGRGSTFWIAVPSTDLRQVALPDSVHVRPGRDATSARPTTVLYIDDNPPNVQLVERIVALRPACTLLIATLGSTGVATAIEQRPDLILLDLHLPDMTGIDVLRRLREAPSTAATPIVIVSADATSSRKRLRELGATDFLAKPFDVRRLLDLIDGVAAAGADSVARSEQEVPHSPVADSYLVGLADDLRAALGVIANHTAVLAHSVVDPVAADRLQQIQRSTQTATTHVRALVRHAHRRTDAAGG